MRLLIIVRIATSCLAFVVNNPFLIAAVFGLTLLFVTCRIRWLSSFVGMVMFLVYIGGIIVLVSYSIMLQPMQKFPGFPALVPLLAAVLSPFYHLRGRSFPFGLLVRISAVLLLGILLFVVLMSIVEIVNYARGMMKYVTSIEVLR